MRKVYLHIGTHRTATTTIQHCLRQYYADIFDTNSYEWGEAMMKVAPLGEKGIVYHRQRLALYATPKLVVSSEGFFGNPYLNYANIDLIAADMQQVLQADNVTVIVAFRQQDTFIESLYEQQCKEGGKMSFGEFVSLINPLGFCWGELVESYRRRFNRVVILKYEDKDFISKFFETIGVSLPFKLTDHNVSGQGRKPYDKIGHYNDKERTELLAYYENLSSRL